MVPVHFFFPPGAPGSITYVGLLLRFHCDRSAETGRTRNLRTDSRYTTINNGAQRKVLKGGRYKKAWAFCLQAARAAITVTLSSQSRPCHLTIAPSSARRSGSGQGCPSRHPSAGA